MTRNEAIRHLRTYSTTMGSGQTTDDQHKEAKKMAIKALSEPKTGEWICKGDYAVCSECGGSSGTQFDGVERIPRTTAFCPNCGADMRGEEA